MKKNSKFPFFDTIRRVMKETYKGDNTIFKLCFLFTIVSCIYPFCGIFLPKTILSILSRNSNKIIYEVSICVASFFLIMAVTNFIKVYIANTIYVRFTKLRIIYIKERFQKISNIAYHYLEESSFFDENEKAIDSTNGRGKGIDGVYNKLFELPSIILITLILLILISRQNIIITIIIICQMAIQLYVTQVNRNFQFSKNQEIVHTHRRVRHYFKTTYDFRYGKDIRLFKLKDRLLCNYDHEIDEYVKQQDQVYDHEFKFSFLPLITNMIFNPAIYAFLIYGTFKGLDMDVFVMYILVISELDNYLKQLAENIIVLTTESQYVSEFYRFIDSDMEEIENVKQNSNVKDADITFQNVSFKYPFTNNYVLQKFSLKINKGEKIAIVGSNGTGKSTVTKLLMGLYTSYDGKITINGQDIKWMKRKDLFRKFSVVFQDFNIYAFTVVENIATGCENMDQDRVSQVLEEIDMNEFVNQLPNKMNHPLLKMIDDGAELSGGQMQKIAIARALYKDADIVVLDEPTASFDAIAEQKIYTNMAQLAKNKTVLFISHRLASTQFCDRIILLNENGICEVGTHEKLMSKKGEYYKMYRLQGKYYQEDV